MTSKSNRSPASRVAPQRREEPASGGGGVPALEPRPFRRRPKLLMASAVALILWFAFLSLMAWHQWRQETKGSPLQAGQGSGERDARR